MNCHHPSICQDYCYDHTHNTRRKRRRCRCDDRESIPTTASLSKPPQWNRTLFDCRWIFVLIFLLFCCVFRIRFSLVEAAVETPNSHTLHKSMVQRWWYNNNSKPKPKPKPKRPLFSSRSTDTVEWTSSSPSAAATATGNSNATTTTSTQTRSSAEKEEEVEVELSTRDSETITRSSMGSGSAYNALSSSSSSSSSSSTALVSSAAALSSLSTLLKRIVGSAFENKHRVARVTASSVQVGLVLYLAHSVWKACAEILEEYSTSAAELWGTGTGASNTIMMEPLLFPKTDLVAKALQICEQEIHALSTPLSSSSYSSSTMNPPPLPSNTSTATTPTSPTHPRNPPNPDPTPTASAASASATASRSSSSMVTITHAMVPVFQMIRRLLAAGLSLRSTHERTTSVESVLLQLTKPEASLLQQCLWTPPPPPPSFSSSSNPHKNDHNNNINIWNEVAGLALVKERLFSALGWLLQGTHSPINPAQQAFQGLFADDSTTTGASTSISSTATAMTTTTTTTMNGGVLLYGPPGCGKTLLVRALASTARVPCLVVTPSTLLRKYVGETNYQVRTLFSLAQKLAPCIVCIDELDGLFRERSDHEHEVSRDLKTEFLQWWDGMLSDPLSSSSSSFSFSSSSSSVSSLSDYSIVPLMVKRQPILVIGSTNRPFDVDAAVLRRLPTSQYVGLPDTATRFVYLQRLLDKVPSNVHIEDIAVRTEGYTPSDLRQVLQTAAVMGPMREFQQLQKQQQQQQDRADDPAHTNHSSSSTPAANTNNNTTGLLRPRSLQTEDVLRALQYTPPTPLSESYCQALHNFASRNRGNRRNRARASSSFSSTALSRSILNTGSRRSNRRRSRFVDPSTDADGTGDAHDADRATAWETHQGTFYHLGQLDVDPYSFDTILSEVFPPPSSSSSSSSSPMPPSPSSLLYEDEDEDDEYEYDTDENVDHHPHHNNNANRENVEDRENKPAEDEGTLHQSEEEEEEEEEEESDLD